MRKLIALCALAVLFNVRQAAAQERDPNDVVAQVLNYSAFGNDDGGSLEGGFGGSYWYQDKSDKCRYHQSGPSSQKDQVIDLNAIDPRNIRFLVNADGTTTIFNDNLDLFPFWGHGVRHIERLERGWHLIYSKYCRGKKKPF